MLRRSNRPRPHFAVMMGGGGSFVVGVRVRSLPEFRSGVALGWVQVAAYLMLRRPMTGGDRPGKLAFTNFSNKPLEV